MLQPKKIKYRKMHRGRLSGNSFKTANLYFGICGLQAQEPTWLNSKQIEAIKRTISYHTKRNFKLWVNVFPDKSITARTEESRMGSGKGNVKDWVAVIKPGTIIVELTTQDINICIKALKAAQYKLPIKTKILQKI